MARGTFRRLSPIRLTPLRQPLNHITLSRVSAGGPILPVTYPTTPLRTRVRVALGADLSADPLTWPWADISDKVRWDLGIGLTVGRRDEATQGIAGQGQMKLDNRDARFTRRNPTGPYYGLLSKNTPIWGEVDAGSGWKTRMEMYVNEWPKAWADKSANDSTVTIGCAGVLRRLAQGKALKSAMRRATAAQSPTVYWPLEDGSSATEAARFGGGAAMVLSGSAAGGATGPDGAASSWTMAGGGTLTGATGLSGTTTSFEISATVRWDTLPSVPVSITTFPIMYADTPDGYVFQVGFMFGYDTFASSFYVNGFIQQPGSGLSSLSRFLSAPTYVTAGSVKHLRLVVYQGTIGLIDTRLYVNGQYVAFSGTGVGTNTVGKPTTVAINKVVEFYAPANTPSISHVSVTSPARDTTAVATEGFTTAAPEYLTVNGYTGEQAHARIARLCLEEGVTYESVASTSPAMGPQGTGTLVALLREAEAVGGGVLYEKRWGLAYQSLRERYNAPVALALDIAQGHLAETPVPADDDQRTRNLFIASRPNGSEYTAEETTGPMGTGAQGPGVFDDGAAFNVAADAQLASQAGWHKHLGIIDEDRWPDLALNFAHNPEFIDTWTSLPPGARITLANPLAQMPSGDTPDLVVEGYSERWDSKRWGASLNCSPASIYRVHVVESTSGNLGRVDNPSSYLTADATSTATTLTVASPSALWRPGPVNFDIAVAGERMTVTNIASAMQDTFTRVVAAGSWGSGESNGWGVDLGTATDFFVNGSVGVMSHSTVGANHSVITDLGGPNQWSTTYFRIPVLPTGGGAAVIYELRGRWIDNTNHYAARFGVDTAGVISFEMRRRSTITGGIIYSGGPTLTLDVTHTYAISLYTNGSDIRAKLWDATAQSEPDWQIAANDSGQAGGNLLCLLTVPVSITNPLPYEVYFDSVTGVLLDGVQTFTVTRSVNGIVKAQPATVGGFTTKVGLWKPGVYAL